jgi:DNA uptake protein ComE-like DNA-binding protein
MRVRAACRAALVAAALIAGAATAQAQVGRNVDGVLDPNLATREQLLTVPHVTPALADAVVRGRPYLDALALDRVVAAAVPAEKRVETYRKLFVPINLNTATREEILLVPGAGPRMAREFNEYRPWINYVQFRREIGKYVSQEEVARLAQYTYIPLDPNTASDEDILSIPGVGPRMLREFREYRPWRSVEQFRREMGKYVDRNEVARLERYIVIK